MFPGIKGVTPSTLSQHSHSKLFHNTLTLQKSAFDRSNSCPSISEIVFSYLKEIIIFVSVELMV